MCRQKSRFVELRANDDNEGDSEWDCRLIRRHRHDTGDRSRSDSCRERSVVSKTLTSS